MTDEATWARRVTEWKASGQSSPDFCKDKDFTPGGLRHWAHKLGATESRPAPLVRVAKVVRVASSKATTAGPDLVLEVEGARIAVRRGFDRETLAAVVDVLRGRR